MSLVDYFVIGFYLCLILSIGPAYKRFSKTASDFFRGGGGMLWWMVGASAWVTGFTAWTFTGGAGKAYSTGTFFLILALANTIATIFTFYTAPLFRQMRVITGIEAVAQRFGRSNEQFFTWLPVPFGIMFGGISLYAIGIFMSVVFQVPISTVIIVLGLVATILAIIGGSQAVMASDFVQMLTILSITLVISYLAISHPGVGGLSGLYARMPAEYLDWTEFDRPAVLWIFGITLVINQFIQNNSIIAGASKFVFCKTGKDARRALWFPLIGTVVVFPIFILPALAAKVALPDLATMFPDLKNPSEAAYVAMAMAVLPKGMLGLLVCGIFAATMTSMDSGLNRGAGIFVRNFWIVHVDQQAGEDRQIFVGKIATAFLGIAQIIVGLVFSTFQQMPLFDLILLLAALIGLPIAVPLFFGMFIKRTPAWSGWSTVIVGMIGGFAMRPILASDQIQSLLPWLPQMSANELTDMNIAITTGVTFAICLIWFCATIPFNRFSKPAYTRQVDDFFVQMHTPIDMQTEHIADWNEDRKHYHVVGTLCMVFGGFVLALMLLPNPMWGRMCFVFCGGSIGGLGLILFLIGKRDTAPFAKPRQTQAQLAVESVPVAE